MKILVTGGTGFIGSNIAKKLKKFGHDVYILCKDNSIKTDNDYKVILYKENLFDLVDEFKKIKFDLIIHCAALFISEHKTENVDELIKSNVLLTTHILEAMKESGVKKIINTSTSWQHFNDEAYNPVCLYAATKQAAEDIIKFYCEAYSMDCITLTIFDSYGPNDTRKKLIKLLFDTSKNNIQLELSPGEQYIDYIYIDDIVDGYIKSMEYLVKNEISGFNKYYLNSDNPLKLKDIIKIFEKVFNTKLNVILGGKEYRNREVMTTYKKGERLPKWYPQYTFEEGLTKMKSKEKQY